MNNIPKTIHYCWFGGNQLPDDAKRYIETWKRYCPDYKIIEWNETNFDVFQNQYCREAYEAKKWAFVSDYVRLKVLYDHGGIYMDTDVEVCKNLDDLLIYSACTGFESNTGIVTGIIMACKNNEWIGYLLDYYTDKHFLDEKGKCDLTTNVTVITNMTVKKYSLLLNNKKQVFGGSNVIFPFDYFCAKSLDDGKIRMTSNTYTIHHFAGSWLTPLQKCRHKIKELLVKVVGVDIVNLIRRII